MKVTLLDDFNYQSAMDKIYAAVCICKNPEIMDMVKNDSNESKTKLIQKVISSGHESITEHVTFTFLLENVSRSLTHQLVRHRIASYTQLSQRYTKLTEPNFVPAPEYFSPEQVKRYNEIQNSIFDYYNELLQMGIKPEDARLVLPNATCTNIIVTMNCRSLKNFFGLRLCKRAQKEIRVAAEMMAGICREKLPVVFSDCHWAEPKCVQMGKCNEAKSCGYFHLNNLK